MKSTVACLLLAFASLALANSYPRGCVNYANGRCVESCPVGTHVYATGCDYLMPEATCENPDPVKDTRGKICDYSSCYCDPPTVRDEKTNKCVNLDECTQKENALCHK